jgi:hypothetical protein
MRSVLAAFTAKLGQLDFLSHVDLVAILDVVLALADTTSQCKYLPGAFFSHNLTILTQILNCGGRSRGRRGNRFSRSGRDDGSDGNYGSDRSYRWRRSNLGNRSVEFSLNGLGIGGRGFVFCPTVLADPDSQGFAGSLVDLVSDNSAAI